MTAVDEELVAVVDESGAVTGSAPRSLVRRDNLPHAVVAVLVRDPAGRIYVHRRTGTKDVFPDMHDCWVAGCMTAGEEPEAAAARELEEELGITATPTYRFTQRYDGPSGRCIGGVYDVVWDGPIVWQPEEVAWGAFVPLDEVAEMTARDRFCPDGLEMFERWRRERDR
jgi:8-oxo-dGTP pyrophosphatase MutT (NUDIX family)